MKRLRVSLYQIYQKCKTKWNKNQHSSSKKTEIEWWIPFFRRVWPRHTQPDLDDQRVCSVHSTCSVTIFPYLQQPPPPFLFLLLRYDRTFHPVCWRKDETERKLSVFWTSSLTKTAGIQILVGKLACDRGLTVASKAKRQEPCKNFSLLETTRSKLRGKQKYFVLHQW